MSLCPRRFAVRFTCSAATRPHPRRAVHRLSRTDRSLLAHKTRRSRQKTGLLYTLELLANLIANQPPEAVPVLISDAVQQQTPIVVMWTIPPRADSPPWPRPFSALIAEEGDSVGGKLESLNQSGIRQNADELHRLDSHTSFQDVGVMAAFPRSAFVPGRKVVIYLRLPTSHPREYKGVQVFGLIEWNGARR